MRNREVIADQLLRKTETPRSPQGHRGVRQFDPGLIRVRRCHPLSDEDGGLHTHPKRKF